MVSAVVTSLSPRRTPSPPLVSQATWLPPGSAVAEGLKFESGDAGAGQGRPRFRQPEQTRLLVRHEVDDASATTVASVSRPYTDDSGNRFPPRYISELSGS